MRRQVVTFANVELKLMLIWQSEAEEVEVDEETRKVAEADRELCRRFVSNNNTSKSGQEWLVLLLLVFVLEMVVVH